MVVEPLKKMSEEYQQLTWLKNKAANEQKQNKVLEQTLNVATKKLPNKTKENQIMAQRITMLHEENKAEVL